MRRLFLQPLRAMSTSILTFIIFGSAVPQVTESASPPQPGSHLTTNKQPHPLRVKFVRYPFNNEPLRVLFLPPEANSFLNKTMVCI